MELWAPAQVLNRHCGAIPLLRIVKEDDSDYVFGDALPTNEINNDAGLDVSPSVRDFLNLTDIDIIDWQFVDFDEVPDGPWKEIITNSKIYWE